MLQDILSHDDVELSILKSLALQVFTADALPESARGNIRKELCIDVTLALALEFVR